MYTVDSITSEGAWEIRFNEHNKIIKNANVCVFYTLHTCHVPRPNVGIKSFVYESSTCFIILL